MPAIAWAIRTHYRRQYTLIHRDPNSPEAPNLIPVVVLCNSLSEDRELPYVKIRFPRSEYKIEVKVIRDEASIREFMQNSFAEMETSPKAIFAVITRAKGGHHMFGPEGQFGVELGERVKDLNCIHRNYIVGSRPSTTNICRKKIAICVLYYKYRNKSHPRD